MACAGVRVCANSHSAGYSVSLNAMRDSVFLHELCQDLSRGQRTQASSSLVCRVRDCTESFPGEHLSGHLPESRPSGWADNGHCQITLEGAGRGRRPLSLWEIATGGRKEGEG